MPKIFISYRRDDSAGIAGRLYDRLQSRFGRENVFMDIDAIPLGVDFREHLQSAVGQCDVLLAIVGRNWFGRTPDGNRRLDDPKDFVRVELEAALARNIFVIPVLIDLTKMPAETELPPSLANLAYRNASEIAHGRDFHAHVDRLIHGIEHCLPGSASSSVGSVGASAPTADLPHSPAEGCFGRGEECRSKEQWDEAITHFSKAIEIDPKYADAFFKRGNVRLRTGRPDKAIADYNEAIRINPKNAKYRNNRGKAHLEAKQYDLAIADYDEAIRLDPNNAMYLDNRGEAREANGHGDRAIADYSAAIRLDPNIPKDATVYTERAVRWLTNKEFGRAIATFTEATRLDPNNAAYNNNLALAKVKSQCMHFIDCGNARLAKGDLDGAIADYDAALHISSKDPVVTSAYANRGKARYEKGDLDGAIVDYDAALRVDPMYATGYHCRGVLRLEMGDLDGAIADFSKSLELEPSNVTYYHNLEMAKKRRR